MKFYDVFVYGTLRKTGSNHHYLQDAQCVQDNVLLSGFCLYDYQHLYPFMLPASPEEAVSGEVYRVNSAQLEVLNLLEDTANRLYRLVYLSDDRFYTYLKYDQQVDGLIKIEGGDWISYYRSLRI